MSAPRHQPLEMTAVITKKKLGLNLAAATVALGMFAATATAQQPPPAPAAPAAPAKVLPKAPAAKAPVAKAPAAAPAAPAKAEAPVAPKAAKAKVAKATEPSPCKGLSEAACKAKADACGWIVPKNANKKTGVVDKPYCRKVAGIAKKKVDAAAPPAKK